MKVTQETKFRLSKKGFVEDGSRLKEISAAPACVWVEETLVGRPRQEAGMSTWAGPVGHRLSCLLGPPASPLQLSRMPQLLPHSSDSGCVGWRPDFYKPRVTGTPSQISLRETYGEPPQDIKVVSPPPHLLKHLMHYCPPGATHRLRTYHELRKQPLTSPAPCCGSEGA